MSQHVQYDANIIKTFATKLYLQAQSTVRIVTAAAAFVGLLVGGALGSAADIGIIAGPVCAILAGLIGYWFGLQLAFKLKLQAQIALCQVQIEENTRATVAAQRPGPRSIRPQAA